MGCCEASVFAREAEDMNCNWRFSACPAAPTNAAACAMDVEHAMEAEEAAEDQPHLNDKSDAEISDDRRLLDRALAQDRQVDALLRRSDKSTGG